MTPLATGLIACLIKLSVSRLTEFKVETLLFGDNNIDYKDNVTIMLAVHEYIKDTGRF